MTSAPHLPIFADGKEPDALRTIGEVAAALGIKQHVLRYWEQQFPMLQPLKRSGGRRYYRREDVELVATIDRLINGEGYTLKGARQALEKKSGQSESVRAEPVEAWSSRRGSAPASLPTSSGQADVELISRLSAIRARLAAALAA